MSEVHIGDVIAGKYRVDRVIGRGAMGLVVAATHIQLDRVVALKLLRTASEGDRDERLGRLVREARAVAKIRSEHVARVLDVGVPEDGTSGDRPFIVMEYLEGHDLAWHVRAEGPLSVIEVSEYLLQASDGLAEAHAAGIVHRDLKPANLFLTRDALGAPIIKVLDFGISKAEVPAAASDRLTRASAILGSPEYIAPEQILSSRDADARSDIWSLGVVAYRLLTGNNPFRDASLTGLFGSILEDMPAPLHEVRPDVPRDFSDTIMRCLAKRPDDRFPHLAALAERLLPFAPPRSRALVDKIAASLRVRSAPLPPTSSSPIAITCDESEPLIDRIRPRTSKPEKPALPEDLAAFAKPAAKRAAPVIAGGRALLVRARRAPVVVAAALGMLFGIVAPALVPSSTARPTTPVHAAPPPASPPPTSLPPASPPVAPPMEAVAVVAPLARPATPAARASTVPRTADSTSRSPKAAQRGDAPFEYRDDVADLHSNTTW